MIDMQDKQLSVSSGSEIPSLALTEPPSVCLVVGDLKLKGNRVSETRQVNSFLKDLSNKVNLSDDEVD